MLHFSFSTILMALLTSSLLIGLIAIVFCRNDTMVCAGYKLLAVFAGLAVIRLFFPFGFPFTTNVYFSPMLSKIVFFLRHPQVQILNIEFSIWNFFEIVWIIGTIINLIRYISQYFFTKNYIKKYGQDHTGDTKYKTILDKICMKHNKKNNFRIMELPDISIPIIFGLKDPCIILPVGLSIPSDKLYYVLYHEAMHHFHHDLLIKGIIRIFSIIYWWNPAFNLLYKQANAILEMRIDKIITHDDAEVTSEYTECLLYMKKNSIKHLSQPSDFLKKNSCYLIRLQDKDFKRRLYMLLQDYAVPKKVFTGIILTVLITSIYLSSYLIVLEAAYFPSQIEETVLIPNSDNMYFIENINSGYDVYINDIYIETIDSLDNYPSGIKIYNKKGDLINEN